MATTGKIYLPNNTTFEGKIRYGLPFEGKLTYNELGDSFYGTFDRGQPHDGEFALWDGVRIRIINGNKNYGEIFYPIGDVYEGDLRKLKPRGRGITMYNDGIFE